MGQGLQRAVNAARASQGRPPLTFRDPPRHPAEVTRARLLSHYEKWNDRLSGQALDAISLVREALARIADKDED